METVYLNGKVVTVDGRFTIAQAFAVRDGVFTAVGSSAELSGRPGPVVDLGGQTVLPGFIDAHAHSVLRGILDAAEPSLAGATSVAEVAARIGAAAAKAEPGAWIVPSPLGEPPDFFGLPGKWAEGRWPTRSDLDAVAPENPVHIPTSVYWPHPAVLNSRALELLELTDEPGLRIVRDASGEPTGLVHGLTPYRAESPAVRRMMALQPQLPVPARRAAIARALDENLALGVTSIYEGHANAFTADLQALHATGRLACRVVATHEMPVAHPDPDAWLSSLPTTSGDDLLEMAGVTVSVDGPTHFGRALMHEPYLDPLDEPGNGVAALSTTDLTAIARLCVQHGIRLNVLASGDRAAEIAVTALMAVHRETPLTGRNWVAQHFHHATREQIACLAEMGMVAQTCAGVDYGRGEAAYVNRLPGKLWEQVAPMRWWLDAGVPVATASDATHHDPLFQLWAALTRVDGRTGRSRQTPAKTITCKEAVRALTMGGAAVLGRSARVGSIEPGKLADFVLLDRDVLTCPVKDLPTARVAETFLGGELVFRR
ncbi:amidohydrolase [Amycolatopsis jejuensis]|uniref:amidohydrolase n=1 Tax=Amycolatopsis jejuensis TaxID=330084 RepID=UPI000525D16D|nr:amidohydrolase family protein [Amycolatopsis jejuensis]